MLTLFSPVTAPAFVAVDVPKTEFDGFNKILRVHLLLLAQGDPTDPKNAIGPYVVEVSNTTSSEISRDAVRGDRWGVFVQDGITETTGGYDALVVAMQLGGAAANDAALQWLLDHGVIDASLAGTVG